MSDEPQQRTEAQIPADHYRDGHYDTRERFASYWHQIEEVLRTAASDVLSVGIGSGIVETYLRMRGLSVVTVDVNVNLKPDLVSDVRQLPIQTSAFDVVLCAQVVEHLPFEELPAVLSELGRVARRRVIISFPDVRPCWRVHIDFPLLKSIRTLVEWPLMSGAEGRWRDHHWEANRSPVPLTSVLRVVEQAGLRVVRTYRVFEMPYHRFAVLEQSQA